MSLTAAAIKIMADKGLSAHDIADIAAANERRPDPTAAERMRNMRARKKATPVTQRNVTRTPPNDIDILTPEVSEPIGSSPQPWACPVGVDPSHWADFRRNRKTKRLTDSPTAYEGQLRAIANLADDEWPPGRLVQHAAEKGWGSICDPRESKYGTVSNIGKSQAAWAMLNPGDEPF